MLTARDAVSPATEAILVGSHDDQTPRWQPGERLHHLFEQRCDSLRESGEQDQPAVSDGQTTWTYDALDARANQVARYLLARGVRAGDRVGLLFDNGVLSYLGMLAVLKINATYIPLDAGFPSERLGFIARDAEIRFVLSQEHLRSTLGDLSATLLYLDTAQEEIGARPSHRLTESERPEPVDDLCYVIYTSGSTGTPKGVAIEHASICNFIRVAADLYGFQQDDRVYQGLTIAFDFSVEEIWVPWMAGATLVPKPSPTSLVGQELHEFLVEQRVTALCCVPTLLTSLEDDVPGLRFLLVSGEACPQDLVRRWYRPGRRFLNVYGPTEATVTATWTTVHPDDPVTLGVPLPTYSVVILDPDEQRVLPVGKQGEIGIAGIGLAREYLNLAERTAQSFIPDFVGLDNNPSGRIYRTGDLGTINERGEVEYHGRIDTQVKIRGYRIELTEIESVLLQMPGVAQAAVDTHDPGSGVTELVAYYSVRRNAGTVATADINAYLRERLPAYMVPAYLERLDTIPMLASDKADRKNLPKPTGQRWQASGQAITAPRNEIEAKLTGALAPVLGLPAGSISVDSNFFDELGANSLLLARFRAQLRRDSSLPPVSMREIYEHPSIEKLATALESSPAHPGSEPPSSPANAPDGAAPAPRVSTLHYMMCGAGQLLAIGTYLYVLALLFTPGFDWIATAPGLLDTYLRALTVGAGLFLVLCVVPIALKWVLIGRWRSTEIPLWGLGYLRFWFVKALVRSNPMMLFVGSPLYTLYLRSLGAKLGPDVVVLTRHVPVCTDLFTVGAHSLIRKDSFVNCYTAQAGRIRTGPVTLGDHVIVGEGSVLDINTKIGDHGQLGHSSALHHGHTIPAGTRWHGSPAEPTDVDYRNVAPAKVSPRRKVIHSVLALLPLLVFYLPLDVGIADDSVVEGRWTFDTTPPTQWDFYVRAWDVSGALFFGAVLVGLTVVTTLPRLLNMALHPGRVYPLYGLHYALHRMIFRITNSRFFMYLFGDSAYIVPYLRALGYRLSPVQQTGSNFGVQQQHENPFLVSVGTGTLVSDGLSMINASYSSTSFRLDNTAIGERNFVGNVVRYPAGGRTGHNCLLATKVMVPLDGDTHENVGLLGSPAFTIPRSVQRDAEIAQPQGSAELRRSVAAKTWHNTVTLALFLASRWAYCFGIITLGLLADYLPTPPAVTATAIELLVIFLSLGYFALLERASLRFRRLRPRTCSIYDPAFWRHERFWKFMTPFLAILDGTPFKGLLLRLLGVRVGRQVFDDGCAILEKTLVTIGDGCVLNAGSVIQPHSLEDGAFKSGHIVLESDVTVGVGAFVHYNVHIGRNAVLDADSFLMKGEEIGPCQHWRGNPAQETTIPPAPALLTAVPARQLGDRAAAGLLAEGEVRGIGGAVERS